MKIFKEKFREDNYICFTCDLDWAPEIAIKEMLDFFLGNEIKPTVFVTHESEIVSRYTDKIDRGIHPNFIQPSSQGNSIEEIINYCISLVPDTSVFRSHRWYASNDIYDLLKEKNFKYESNLCTNMDIVEPFVHRSGMISFPVFFEDGAYIMSSEKIDFSKVQDKFNSSGLKVINLHPMHYALNTPYFKYTRQIKDELSREEWNSMSLDTLNELRFGGLGIRSFIDELVQYIKRNDVKIITLEQAYDLAMRRIESV